MMDEISYKMCAVKVRNAKLRNYLDCSKRMIKSSLQLNVKIENESINLNKYAESKTLEVTIDQHLSWRTNTETLTCKKITSGISALNRRLKEFADIKQTLLSVIST